MVCSTIKFCIVRFLLFLFGGKKIVTVHFCTVVVLHSYKSVYGGGGATQKSLELQVLPRNYQCLMVSKMTCFSDEETITKVITFGKSQLSRM